MPKMRCKLCWHVIDRDELTARFQAGLGHCPNPKCNPVDWKYGRPITRPAEFEECSKDGSSSTRP